MQNIKVDYSKVLSFITENEMEDFIKKASKAHEMIQSKTGLGNDFLGWVNLPKDYDKSLFWLKKAKANGFWKAANEYGKVIALTQRGGARTTAKSKPKPIVAKKKAQPKKRVVAKRKTVATVEQDDDLRDLLLRGQWLERGKPGK